MPLEGPLSRIPLTLTLSHQGRGEPDASPAGRGKIYASALRKTSPRPAAGEAGGAEGDAG